MQHARKIFRRLVDLGACRPCRFAPGRSGRRRQPIRTAPCFNAGAQAPVQQEAPEFDRFVSEPVTPSVTLAAADLPAAEPEYWLDREINPRLSYNSVVDPNFNPAGGPDPLPVDQEFAPRVYLPLL